MNREAPPSMGGDLVRWLEQATAMIEDRREARDIRLDLTAHYEDIRAELERDGLSSAEAHRQSLARLGEADRLSRDWPRTAGDSRAVPWTIILAGVVLQIPSLFWRPLLPLSWLVLALGGVFFFSKIRTVGTVLVQYWAGQIRLVPTRLLALAGVMGAPLGFEPVWAGQYLEHWMPGLRFVWFAGWLLLEVLAGAALVMRGVHSRRGRGDGGVSAGLVGGFWGGTAAGLLATLIWMTHIGHPGPGHIGFLPGWPWQAVSRTFEFRLVPGALLISAYFLGLVAWARRRPRGTEPGETSLPGSL